MKFLRIYKLCFMGPDVHAQYLQAMNARKGSVAIILSYSGQTQEMIRCAEELNKNGVPIILISRFGSSALAKMAETAVEEAVEAGKKRLMITHCNNLRSAECVRRHIEEKLHFKETLILDTAGVSSMYANEGGVIVTISVKCGAACHLAQIRG